MDPKDVIAPALITAIVGGLMAYLKKHSEKNITSGEEGRYELRLNKFYWYFGVGCIVGGIASLFLPFFTTKNDASLIGLFLFVVLALLGVVLMIAYSNHRLVYDRENITGTSFFGRKSSLKWVAVERVKFSKASGMIILADHQGNQVKAHMHVIGFNEFVEKVMQHTKKTAGEIGLPPAETRPF